MSRSVIPPLVAGLIGIVSGVYIWREPLEQYRANSGGVPPPAAVEGKEGAAAAPTAATQATPAAEATPAAAAPAAAPAAPAKDVPARRSVSGAASKEVGPPGAKGR